MAWGISLKISSNLISQEKNNIIISLCMYHLQLLAECSRKKERKKERQLKKEIKVGFMYIVNVPVWSALFPFREIHGSEKYFAFRPILPRVIYH